MSSTRAIGKRALGVVVVLGAIGCGSVALAPDGGAKSDGAAGAGAAGHSGSAGATGSDAGSSATITFRLTVPADEPYCDMAMGCALTPVHITILDATHTPIEIDSPSCSVLCVPSCMMGLCPPIFCLATHSQMFTGTEMEWDGTMYGMSTCGAAAQSCYAERQAAGHYIARMCATPGTLSSADANATCVASGAEQCIDVPFDYPGPTPVVGKLP